MKRLNLLLAVAALFLLAACSDDSTSTSTTTTSNGEEISGGWTTGCLAESGGGSFDATLTFSGNGASYSDLIYLSVADCSGTASYTEAGSFTFEFIGTKTMPNDGDVTASTVDSLETARTITPNSDAAATIMISESWYGITDWASGTATDTLGTNFNGTTYTDFTFQTVIYIDESASPNTLQFGLEADDGGTEDADGYSEALVTEVFTKQ